MHGPANPGTFRIPGAQWAGSLRETGPLASLGGQAWRAAQEGLPPTGLCWSDKGGAGRQAWAWAVDGLCVLSLHGSLLLLHDLPSTLTSQSQSLARVLEHQDSCYQQPSQQAELVLHPRGWNRDSVPRTLHCSQAPGRHRSWLFRVSPFLALTSLRGPPSGGQPAWGGLVKGDSASVWWTRPKHSILLAQASTAHQVVTACMWAA